MAKSTLSIGKKTENKNIKKGKPRRSKKNKYGLRKSGRKS